MANAPAWKFDKNIPEVYNDLSPFWGPQTCNENYTQDILNFSDLRQVRDKVVSDATFIKFQLLMQPLPNLYN